MLRLFVIGLFLQEAVVNLPTLDLSVGNVLRRGDEVVIMMFLGLAVLQPRRPRTRDALLVSTVAYVLIQVASAVKNDVQVQIWAGHIFLFLKGFLLLLFCSRLRVTDRQALGLLKLINNLLIVCCVVAFLQMLGVPLPWKRSLRIYLGFEAATSIFNHHTLWGTAAGTGVATIVGVLLSGNRRRYWRISLVVLALGLLISTSRRYIMSVPLSALAVIILTSPRERAVKLLRYTAVSFVVGIVAFPVLMRVGEGTYQEYIVNAETRDRYALYLGALRLVEMSPLLGRGPGMYGSWMSVLYESPVYAQLGISTLVPLQYRNGAPYAGVLGEGGILGFGLYLTIFVILVKKLVSSALHPRSQIHRLMANVSLMLVLGGMLESIVHPYFTGSIATYLCFMMVGLTEAIRLRRPVRSA